MARVKVVSCLYNKIVVGLDQSYTNTGLCIAADGKVLLARNVDLSKCTSKTEKRRCVALAVSKAIELSKARAKSVIVISERIRVFNGQALSLSYVSTTGALVGAIADACYDAEVKHFSADTRAWKAAIVGTTKGASKGPKGMNLNKLPTLRFVLKRADVKRCWIVKPIGKRCKSYDVMEQGVPCKYDDDVADAICIALYGFYKGRSLLQEKV